MEIIKTDAVVLRSIKHSESSRIVSFFTETNGKVSLIAKGARKARPFVPMDTFSLMSIVYRSKSSRDIQLMTSAELLDSFLTVRDDLRKSAAAFAMCDLVNKTTMEDDSNPLLFEALVEALGALNEKSSRPANSLRHFQIRMIETLGFGLDLERCLNCGKKSEDFPGGKTCRFSFESGGIICPECGAGEENAASLKPEVLKTLQYLAGAPVDKIQRLKISPAAGRDIERLLLGFLRRHIEGFKTAPATSFTNFAFEK